MRKKNFLCDFFSLPPANALLFQDLIRQNASTKIFFSWQQQERYKKREKSASRKMKRGEK
jgi:hypothetical protein